MDFDDDGYTDDVDCNDRDSTIHPDAEEICDEIDQDCDEDPLNESGTTYYEDVDGDGYGDPHSFLEACSLPDEYAENDDDCRDDETAINPGAPELCDGKDNICNTVVDEICWDVTTWDEGMWQ